MRPFTRTGAPIMLMDTASAELCKYAANSILAARISFMNEIANVCELVGANVDMVRKGDRRRSPHRELVPLSRRRLRRQLFPEGRVRHSSRRPADKGYDFEILRAVEAVNLTAEVAAREQDGDALRDLAGRTIALWGLAFKPRTDDMREAPSIAIVERTARARREGQGVRS